MSLPNRIAAYEDCFSIYERAAASSKGTRVAFASRGEAEYFAMRMQQARSLQRAESRQVYEPHDTRYDKSLYDSLIVRRAVEDDNGDWWVYIQRHESNILAIEDVENNDATADTD